MKDPKANEPSSNFDKLGLEEIVHLANKIGMEYADAKRDLDELELKKPIIRAKIAIRLDNGELTETKLRRLLDTDDEYLDFVEKLIDTKARVDKLRIRYDSYKNLFDARRSLLSYQKAEMKIL